MDRNSLFRKFRNLPQYKLSSDDDLYKLVDENLEKNEIADSLTFCLPEEKDFALNLLNKYLSESSITSYSEKNTLRNLIDLEILLERVKKFINTEQSKANPTIPLQFLEQVTELTNQIIEVKEKLGLAKSEEQSDFVKVWELLKKKTLKYYEENKGCNTIKCPYCQNLFHLLFDKTNYKEIKATWFRGTQLYNEPLFKLYHEGVLTEDKVAEILGVSKFYVVLMYENLYLKELEK